MSGDPRMKPVLLEYCHEVLAQFLRELDDGLIPRTETTEGIAKALRWTLANVDVSQPRRRGQRRRPTAAEKLNEIAPLLEFIDVHMANDPRSRGARERAMDAAVSEFGKDRRALERTWDSSKKVLPLLRALRRLKTTASK